MRDDEWGSGGSRKSDADTATVSCQWNHTLSRSRLACLNVSASLGGGVSAKANNVNATYTTGIRFGEREPVPEIDTHQGVRGSRSQSVTEIHSGKKPGGMNPLGVKVEGSSTEKGLYLTQRVVSWAG